MSLPLGELLAYCSSLNAEVAHFIQQLTEYFLYFLFENYIRCIVVFIYICVHSFNVLLLIANAIQLLVAFGRWMLSIIIIQYQSTKLRMHRYGNCGSISVLIFEIKMWPVTNTDILLRQGAKEIRQYRLTLMSSLEIRASLSKIHCPNTEEQVSPHTRTHISWHSSSFTYFFFSNPSYSHKVQ